MLVRVTAYSSFVSLDRVKIAGRFVGKADAEHRDCQGCRRWRAQVAQRSRGWCILPSATKCMQSRGMDMTVHPHPPIVPKKTLTL